MKYACQTSVFLFIHCASIFCNWLYFFATAKNNFVASRIVNICFIQSYTCILMVFISMLSLVASVFEFVQLILAVTLMPLQPHSSKYLLVKTSNARISSTVNLK